MNANLSIVLDNDKKVRLDLLKNVPLSEIDKYTITKTDSSAVRKQYEEEISNFLKEHESFISTFKKESNKKGSLVIVYQDEFRQLHKMRVLYQENAKKIDTEKMIANISRVLREAANPYFTISIFDNFSFFLSSPYDKKEINTVKKRLCKDDKINRAQNQRLINLLRNHLKEKLSQNPEKCYFYVRLIDAYLEKNGLETTKRTLKTKSGKVEISNQKIEEKAKDKEAKVTRNTKYHGKTMLVEDEDVKIHPYYEEANGQYNFFNPDTQNPIQEKKRYAKYERFLESEDSISGKGNPRL